MTAMLLLGLLVAVAAGAFAGLLLADNTTGGPHHPVALPGHHVVAIDTRQAFLYGIALAFVFCLGVAAIRRGTAKRRRRHEARIAELRDAGRIRAERDALAARLGIPVDQGLLDETEPTAPLPPLSIFPWTKP